MLEKQLIQCHLYSHGDGPDLHALGAAEHLILESTSDAWNQAKAFMDQHDGKSIFSALSYELKDDLESLSSKNPAYIPFPSLVLFVPKLLYTYEVGELELIERNCDTIESRQLEEALHALHHHEPSPAAPSELVAPADADQYIKHVRQVLEHIQAGDIYEANYCQEFKLRCPKLNPWELFQNLRKRSHAPYSCHLRVEHLHLLCASPELFLEKEGLRVQSKPIKGTRKRSKDPKEDQRLKAELASDLKERAENIMICDLVRNDLSRTAKSGSVQVTELCEVYSYDTVHQMISTVQSEVEPDTHPLDIIKHAFPMGSMTGAPKIEAMEIIERLETFKRGIYSGSVGYFSPSRDFTLNVVIRSILYDEDTQQASLAAGGAITALSEPQAEYEESLLKAKLMLDALGIGKRDL